jgi:transcriptional regulator GlxA family with amidase domain
LHRTLWLLLLLSLAGCATQSAPARTTIQLNPEVPIIGVLAFDKVLTSEVTAPVEVLGAATHRGLPYQVVVISGSRSLDVTTEEGLTVVADATIYDDLDLDVLIVPGAYDLQALTADEALMSYLKREGAQVTWLASNCSGAFLLAHAGLLNGVKATTWAGGEADLKKTYPKVDVQFDQNVVMDKNIITSNGGAVSYQASLALLRKLGTPEQTQEVSEMLQIPRLARGLAPAAPAPEPTPEPAPAP